MKDSLQKFSNDCTLETGKGKTREESRTIDLEVILTTSRPEIETSTLFSEKRIVTT